MNEFVSLKSTLTLKNKNKIGLHSVVTAGKRWASAERARPHISFYFERDKNWTLDADRVVMMDGWTPGKSQRSSYNMRKMRLQGDNLKSQCCAHSYRANYITFCKWNFGLCRSTTMSKHDVCSLLCYLLSSEEAACLVAVVCRLTYARWNEKWLRTKFQRSSEFPNRFLARRCFIIRPYDICARNM